MRIAGWLKWLTLCVAAFAVAPAAALDPSRTIAQYKHTKWSVEDGAPAGILSLAQGGSGYLWIGGRDGVFRFDGISFEHIASGVPGRAPGAASAMLVARDGSIWIGFAAGGIARYRNGQLIDTNVPNGQAYVMNIVESADGAIWAMMGGGSPPILRFADGRWQSMVNQFGSPGEGNVDALPAKNGTLWITTTSGVFTVHPGEKRFRRMPFPVNGHAALSEDPAGHIWLSDANGSRVISGGVTTRIPYPTPAFPRAARTFFDRDGNLWVDTALKGIYRLRTPRPEGEANAADAAARIEPFGQAQGLPTDSTRNLIEDREGNIWIAHDRGLDRLRGANVAVEPLLTRVPSWGDVLLGASDGSVYVGEAPGVYRIVPGGKPQLVVDKAGEAEAMCEGPDGAVWMIQADRIVRFVPGQTTTNVARPNTRQAIIDCAVDRSNALWLTGAEGLFQRIPGGWRLHQAPASEDSSGNMPIIRQRDGSLLIYATDRSFRRIDYPRFADTILDRPRLLIGLKTVYERPRDILAGGNFGLVRLRGNRASFITPKREPALASISGIVETPRGETWIISAKGIVQLSSAALERAFDDPRAPLSPQIFDYRDGLTGFGSRDGKRDAVRGGDGRLWFATTSGTVWIDPASLKPNTLAPPVAIAALKTSGANYRDPVHLDLPAGTSTVEIDYAALSLSIPERVEVRYRLEGADTDWIDPGTRRQAFYTNLRPGTYRFRVIAANNDGVWNRQGATFEFTVAPTFLQSNWFLLLCLIGLGLLAWLAYSVRVRQVTGRIRAGLEVRLAERERIARELHDTLLQTFQGLVLRFQAVADRIPSEQPLRTVIDQALERADEALLEGRSRVLELRVARGDLGQALLRVAEECGTDGTTRFNLVVEGRPRALHPTVSDEVERIGAEAIRNAFQHAQAREIDAVLSYRLHELRFDLHDDGVGLPANIVERGEREGHYGLTGMRERARQIGGTLTISSREKGGTEVALSVPGRAAYTDGRRRWRIASIVQDWLKG